MAEDGCRVRLVEIQTFIAECNAIMTSALPDFCTDDYLMSGLRYDRGGRETYGGDLRLSMLSAKPVIHHDMRQSRQLLCTFPVLTASWWF